MAPRRAKMSPRRARVSSGRSREASGSDLGPISEAFLSSLRARARAARHPPHSQSSCSRCSTLGYLLRGASWCFALVLLAVLCASLLVFSVAARSMFSQPSPGSSQKAPNKNARETHEMFQLQSPGERAQRASKGCTRPTTLAILMLAMLSPRWLRGASWCFALVLLAFLCASLLVCSVAVEACGLAPEQGYRLVLRLACFSAFPGIEPESSGNKHEKLTKRSSSKRPASARSMFLSLPRDRARKLRTKTLEKLTRHDTTRHDTTRQEKTRQDQTRQGKARQGKKRQDTTRQDTRRHDQD